MPSLMYKYRDGDEVFAEKLLREERVAVVQAAIWCAGSGFVRCSYATAYKNWRSAGKNWFNFLKRILNI